MEKQQCSNCHKYGHLYRNCNEPQTSYGIICYTKIDDEYKIVLIRRKDTIGFMEFIRGKYDINNIDYIVELFDLMTNHEKEIILKHKNFDTLRNIQGMTREITINVKEYNNSEWKFNQIKDKLDEIVSKSKSNWEFPEWGLPKGRKNSREIPKLCAIREFYEETGLTKNDIIFHPNIVPLEELYTGINGIKYKHIYYFAEFINDESKLIFNPDDYMQSIEVSDIMWCNYLDASKLIRPYHKEKLNIVKKALQILKTKDKYFNTISDCPYNF